MARSHQGFAQARGIVRGRHWGARWHEAPLQLRPNATKVMARTRHGITWMRHTCAGAKEGTQLRDTLHYFHLEWSCTKWVFNSLLLWRAPLKAFSLSIKSSTLAHFNSIFLLGFSSAIFSFELPSSRFLAFVMRFT
ncbi:hypothetical protein PIB30_081038 [Stylosanthes scabra]|uniref:Uncharacterized protein n=1 Tax=Stylosanthes scabra TaxID=79078 RepID=A0ABU6WPT8_9FABA|nr:hypothetical protein [Stylosanthes scabra]